MQIKRTYFQTAGYMIAALLLATSCEMKNLYDPEYNQEAPSVVPFTTTQPVEISMGVDLTRGLVTAYNLYTENPLDENGELRTDLQTVGGGIFVAGVSPHQKFVLPAYAKDLYMYSYNRFFPQVMQASITNGQAVFAPTYEADTRTIGEGESGVSGADTGIDTYIVDQATGLTDSYDIANPDSIQMIPFEVRNAISQEFLERDRGYQVPDTYKQDATLEILSDNKGNGVRIFISAAFSEGQYANAMNYVVVPADKNIDTMTKAEIQALEVFNVLSYASVIGNGNGTQARPDGLTPGKYVQLKYRNEEGNLVDTFPVGVKVVWVLKSNCFDRSTGTIGNDILSEFATEWVFSESRWNTLFYPLNGYDGKKSIYFSAADNNGGVHTFFGMDDTHSNAWDNDCNDIIFSIIVDPADALTPPPTIPEPKPVTHTVSREGVLAFEDQWPMKGDYDMNDVVVEYNSAITYVYDSNTQELADATIQKIVDTWSFVHNGATFDNTFSYKVNIDPAYISSVTIGETPETVIPDGDGFIINVVENVKDIIPIFTSPAEPITYTVTMIFANNTFKQNDLADELAPYNPFIRPTNPNIPSDGIEVHVPFYAPTEGMDTALFGTFDDCSEPSKGIYFVSTEDNNYPFALHLSGIKNGAWAIPDESVLISDFYPGFDEWVAGGCSDVAADWYLHNEE
ncbi:MAG: LruC domain-containing protein [Prevotellaceae bacterium]|jgi:LruC domain-containing protein|nr:LruC domain-containing protein [Prevotellaceae bacterium]